MTPHSPADLEQFYRARFTGNTEYRKKVWNVLCAYFSRWTVPDGAILDLGSGYCEFINQIAAAHKFAMDLNPDTKRSAAPEVDVLLQDCASPWQIENGSLDTVFSSNFLEHLPDKRAVEQTLSNAALALKAGGRIILLGPNIRYLAGEYWDFYDHYVALTHLSLSEVLRKCGFEVDVCVDRFLPYTMSQGKTYPVWMLKLYLSLSFAWPLFGRQFLVVARRL